MNGALTFGLGCWYLIYIQSMKVCSSKMISNNVSVENLAQFNVHGWVKWPPTR